MYAARGVASGFTPNMFRNEATFDQHHPQVLAPVAFGWNRHNVIRIGKLDDYEVRREKPTVLEADSSDVRPAEFAVPRSVTHVGRYQRNARIIEQNGKTGQRALPVLPPCDDSIKQTATPIFIRTLSAEQETFQFIC